MRSEGGKRDSSWTETVAVGCKTFVEEIKEKLGFKAVGRKIMGDKGQTLELREPLSRYNANFDRLVKSLAVVNGA